MPAASIAAIVLHIDTHASNIFSDFFTTMVIAFGFLYLGYRHGSIWLAPAMTIQGAELYILSQELSEHVDPSSLVVWDNVVSCGVAIALVVGTIASARERRAATTAPIFRMHSTVPDAATAGEPKLMLDDHEAVFVLTCPKTIPAV